MSILPISTRRKKNIYFIHNVKTSPPTEVVRGKKDPGAGASLAEVLADHLHSHIASLPLVTIELHSSQTLQIRQMLTQLIRWKPLLPVTRINLPKRLRYLPRTPGILTNPHNLNIHLSSSQYPEYLLLRQFRLANVETHAASSIRRTRFRPILVPSEEPDPETSPRADQ